MQKVTTTTSSVSCSGKEAPHGHPTVYLEIDKQIRTIECPYCSKIFELVLT